MAVRAVPEPASDNSAKPPWRVRGLLGSVILLAGIAILLNVSLVPTIGSGFIGIAALAVGSFEILHAVLTRRWDGVAWQIILGLLYGAVGIVLLSGAGQDTTVVIPGVNRSAQQGSLMLAYGLGLLLMLSGLVRILLGASRWRTGGGIMLLSGTFGILAGLIVLSEFPKTGLWVFGLLLGIDIVSQGLAWLGRASLPTGQKR